MTDEVISRLRRRMIEDMTIRNLTPKTQQGYIRTIKNLAAFIGRSPDKATFEDVRRFQLHLVAKGSDTPTLNHTVSALRFFFRGCPSSKPTAMRGRVMPFETLDQPSRLRRREGLIKCYLWILRLSWTSTMVLARGKRMSAKSFMT
jgi:site-specific recombinase XerD